MDCITCGYYWADVNEDGEPESLEYRHFDGPNGRAPCEYSEDEYVDEADVEAREAEKEAAYEAWLESLPMEQRPTNAKEYIEAWKYFQARYE